jgi:oligopeptide transport system substrate-binding protein
LPPADFSFSNGDEVKTVDPPMATGVPEGRIIDALFEGLYRVHPQGYVLDASGNLIQEPVPDADGNVPMEPVPGAASACRISADGTVYTFTIRETARWSDGTPVTAHDFAWSWQRMLHPETASRYAYQLYYVRGARAYNQAALEPGDRVEVELQGRLRVNQPFPRGPLRRGVLQRILQPPPPSLPVTATEQERDAADAAWRQRWVYLVETRPETEGAIDWEAVGAVQAFSRGAAEDAPRVEGWEGPVVTCQQILIDFESQVGVRAEDDATLVVTLTHRTPFFLDLVAFYPLYPVNRRCVETHGVPAWSNPENLVGNGPFLLEFRRIRDRIRLRRNPHYWDTHPSQLGTVDALAVKSETTALNMYLRGQLDWATTVPNAIIPELRKRRDFLAAPGLITYFYRLNVTRPPLDDVHVRRALNLAIDKRLICEKVTKAGQVPARSFVPPGLPGYHSPQCGAFDIEAARRELSQSRYAREGLPLPKIQILYNTLEAHRAIAEVIQQQWKNNLGIDVELTNTEWATFLDAVHTMDYVVSRAGWVGDYPDPNTFLDMWVTGGENNETGWSRTEYDQLIAAAQSEPDPGRRLETLAKAEEILMDELPILPIYFYVTTNMIQPRVRGFYANIQDQHPLHLLRIDR